MSDYTFQDIYNIYQKLQNEIGKVIKGQEEVIKNILIGLFAGGHILIEGVPGLAKTLIVNVLSHIIGTKFKRIQFTPDLMPSDIIGTTIYNAEIKKFQMKKGPIFTNLLLADEINRAPAKTQSALLQAMQEKKVNIDGIDHPLDDLFVCLATQNPIEMEGTYPLPEAQIDRFLIKVFILYPSLEDEENILSAYKNGFKPDDLKTSGIKNIINEKQVSMIKNTLEKVEVDDKIIHYITKIVHATREHTGIEFGSSPRGSIALFKTSRVNAIFAERDFVTPDDVKDMVFPVLRHRIILDPEIEIEGITPDDLLKEIIERIEVPR